MLTKYQAIRLAKKAMKYPHQLTDGEVLQLDYLMGLTKDIVITPEQKAHADKLLGIDATAK